MQPLEPDHGPTQPSPAAPAPRSGPPEAVASTAFVASARPRNKRLRLWLAMGAGIVALFCLGGVGVAISLYDDATKIERTSPDQVASAFLRAYLANRNDQEAGLFTCKAGADLAAIAQIRTEMINREKDFGTSVRVTWGAWTVTGDDADRKAVSTELTIAGWADGQPVSSRDELWSLDLVDEDGWRVCGVRKST